MKLIVLLCIIITLSSCGKRHSDLENALILSGENRGELEQVLAHYSHDPADSLKLKAAEFLIANMPGHYSYYGSSLDAYRSSVDSSEVLKFLPWSIRNIFYLYPYQDVYSLKNVRRVEDVECITASYLISNIEKAFECWNYPWARHLGFEDFCEYLLPYRIGNEPLDNWRDSLAGVYDTALQRMKGVDELFESPYQACMQLNDRLIEQMKKARADSVSFTHPLIGTKKVVDMKCLEYVPTAVLIMRSLGIPVSLEMIEQWSGRSGRHYWNAVYHFTGLRYPFTGFDSRPRGLNQDYKMNKVYRHTFAANKQSLVYRQPEEDIPDFFEERFMKDVTDEYMTCHDITIDLLRAPSQRCEYAYLCVWNNEAWTPVHYGKIVASDKVTFTRVGPQTMFIAGYYIKDKIVPASLPFHVNLDGTLTYVSVSDTRTVTLPVCRKYPLLHRFANYSRHLAGATMEVSDYPDFRRVDTIGIISHDANTQYDSIYAVRSIPPRRYFRMRHATRPLQLSELETYVAEDTVNCYYGKLFLPPSHLVSGNIYDLYNKSITDYVEIKDWVGIDFGHPVKIQKVKYLPRTDSNHVMAGDVYELFVYKDFAFRSLGEQQASASSLVFEQVPADGLYLLKDKSRGREHRIFTYRDGQVLFW